MSSPLSSSTSSNNSNGSSLTFEALGVTLGTGSVIGVGCFFLFGIAMMYQSPLIAPRCTARPKETIYRRRRHRHVRSSKHHQQQQQTDRYAVQDRGNPFVGWMVWVMKLSYDALLTGIPGTGTRKQGLAGRMLQVNLDGIVLLKYHLIGFKITLLTTLLAICVILPLNLTYHCYPSDYYYSTNSTSAQCVDPKTNQTYDMANLTNFERTTIANIPALSNITFIGTAAKDIIMTPWWWQGGAKSVITIRLYIVAFCTWIVYVFSYYLLHKEWKEILVLRRVYYLEDDIWGRRKDELQALETIRQQLSRSCSDSEDYDHEETNNARSDQEKEHHLTTNDHSAQPTQPPPAERKLFYEFSFSAFPNIPGTKLVQEGISNFQEYRRRITTLSEHHESRLKDVWIFDPEERDTIPNIELYSVLVGRVPTKRSDVFPASDPESSVLESMSDEEWQLQVVRSFFDQCVPNQPGYTSSVAAITILPNAKDLASAWRSWYVCAAKLRRLRFIRSLISEYKRKKNLQASLKNNERIHNIEEATAEEVNLDDPEGPITDSLRSSRALFGSVDCTKIEEQLFEALQYGPGALQNFPLALDTDTMLLIPLSVTTACSLVNDALTEQTAVYSREFAQAAFGCCPLGRHEHKDRRIQDIQTLKKLENEALHQLTDAHHNLLHARKRATANAFPGTNTRLASVEERHTTLTHQTIPGRFGGKLRHRNHHGSTATNSESHRESILLDKEGKAHWYRNEAHHSFLPNGSPYGDTQHLTSCPEDCLNWCNPLGAIPRTSTDSSSKSSTKSDKWKRAEGILLTSTIAATASNESINMARNVSSLTIPKPASDDPILDDGVWEIPTEFLGYVKHILLRFFTGIVNWFIELRDVNKDWESKSAFAVVTFTSRQAALAARHCLTDGRGQNQWITYESLPLPPLADKAPCDIITCRNCCRPVTVTLGKNDVLARSCLSGTLLFLIYCFYTVPFSWAQSLTQKISSGNSRFSDVFPVLSEQVIGLIPSLINIIILSTLPYTFKLLSNSSGKASSLAAAEGIALRYYWWFMLITAFSASYIVSMITSALSSGDFQKSTQELLTQIANTLPTNTSFFWLNWLILRFSMTLPSNYLMQVSTVIFHSLGWKCFVRMTSGGMNGMVVPYRIYVDSGAAFLCAVTLSFMSPLVAPAVLAYYLLAIPLLRRNCIFVYRPAYDGGGFRWPFLFDIFISSMVLAQFLLALVMFLKAAVGCAFISIFPMVPTIIFRNRCRWQYLKAFEDAGLLQASRLDLNDPMAPTYRNKRRKFLDFLVDAHKAAYVPVCIAGDTVSALTATPADVESLDHDMDRN